MVETVLTAQEKARRAINKASVASQGPCYVCKKMLWMSFFFDAPKYDAIEDRGKPDRLTNIGKIFSAHRETNHDLGLYRIYFNGLQKPLNTQDYARVSTADQIAGRILKGQATGKLENAGEQLLKDAAKPGNLEHLSEQLLSSAKSLLNPMNWWQTVLKVITETAVEGIGAIRDNPVVSSLTDSGVTTRINNAITEFQNILNTQTQEITRIRIAIFGADAGAATARAFANKLINSKLKMEGDTFFCGKAEVEFMFMGLFDCVSSRSKNVLNALPLSFGTCGEYAQGLDEPMGIRPQIKYVYHAVAAHENRPYKRLDSVRHCKAPAVDEELFPGDQYDVIGGKQIDAQQRSDQLSRRPLMRMYSAALVQAVPLPSLEQLYKIDGILAISFAMTDKLAENNMLRNTGARILTVIQSRLDADTLEKNLLIAASQRLHWLAIAYRYPEQRRDFATQYARLSHQITRIHQVFADPIAQSPAQDLQNRENLRAELLLMAEWSRYQNIYNRERYRAEISADDAALAGLFEQFIHDALDQMRGDGLDRLETSLLTGDAYWGYLTPRPVDDSDTFA